MFDNDNQERNSNPNRFFFFNNLRKSTPILSREGYATFITTFTVGWVICVAFIFWIQLQFTATKDVISAMASSSVDLAALSLAVLAVLHEFNKEDRWFKLGLFLIGFIFALDCLIGFYLVVSWKDIYALPQNFSIVVFGVFLIGFLFQTDWQLLFSRFSVNIPKAFKKAFSILSNIRLNRIRLSIPFVIPLALIWINNLTPIVAFLLIFLGGIIALLCLMFTTIVLHIRQQRNAEQQDIEDPIITYSRQIAIQQINNNKNIQKLQDSILEVLSYVQEKRIDQIKDSKNAALMIGEDVIFARLRRNGVNLNHQDINNALDLLVRQSRIFRKDHEYWIVPSKSEIELLAQNARKISWLGVMSKTQDKSQIEWKNFELTNQFCDELVHLLCLPYPIVDEFLLPAIYTYFYNNQEFERFFFSGRSSYTRDIVVFINSEVKKKIETFDWKQYLLNAHLAGFRMWTQKQSFKIELERKIDILKAEIEKPISFDDLDELLQSIDEALQGVEFEGESRKVKLQILQEELAVFNELFENITTMDNNTLNNFIIKNYADKSEEYIDIVTSEDYQEGSLLEFSNTASKVIASFLESGVVINDSKIPFLFERYESHVGYQKFLKIIGVNLNPWEFFSSKDQP